LQYSTSEWAQNLARLDRGEMQGDRVISCDARKHSIHIQVRRAALLIFLGKLFLSAGRYGAVWAGRLIWALWGL